MSDLNLCSTHRYRGSERFQLNIKIIGNCNAKVGNQMILRSKIFGHSVQNERNILMELCLENSVFITNAFFQQPKR